MYGHQLPAFISHLRRGLQEIGEARQKLICRRPIKQQSPIFTFLIDKIIENSGGELDTIRVAAIPEEHRRKVEAFASDPLFQKTFQNLPISFKFVEIDKLIAPQRKVNLDYVNRLRESYPKSPTIDDLLDICCSPKREMDPIQHLEVAASTHVFSSPNSDIRFLGAFVKDLTEEYLRYVVMGGLPAAAIIAFVGYGGARSIRNGPSSPFGLDSS